jgi:hypothetical protein
MFWMDGRLMATDGRWKMEVSTKVCVSGMYLYYFIS